MFVATMISAFTAIAVVSVLVWLAVALIIGAQLMYAYKHGGRVDTFTAYVWFGVMTAYLIGMDWFAYRAEDPSTFDYLVCLLTGAFVFGLAMSWRDSLIRKVERRFEQKNAHFRQI